MKMLSIVSWLLSVALVVADRYCREEYECTNGGEKITTSTAYQCDGYRSCHGSTFDSSTAVLCNGDESCRQAVIDSDSYVACRGNYACQYADVIRVDSSLLAQGFYSFQNGNANGDGANNAHCSGERSCQYAELSRFQNVYVYGYYGAQNGYIDSVGTSSMNVILYGYNAGSGTVISCREGDVCTIKCLGEACKTTDVIEFTGSTVKTECDDSTGDVCPEVHDGSSAFAKKLLNSRKSEIAFGRKKGQKEEAVRSRSSSKSRISSKLGWWLVTGGFGIGCFAFGLTMSKVSSSKGGEYQSLI